MKLSKQEAAVMPFAAIFIVLCIYGLVISAFENRSLGNNDGYAGGVILKFDTGVKGSPRLSYYFFVDDERYKGYGRHYPKSDTLSVGDTIRIIYDKTNPKNNRPNRDYIQIFY